MRLLMEEMIKEHPKHHCVEYYATVLGLENYQISNYIRTLNKRGWLDVSAGITRPYYALKDEVKDAILTLGVEYCIKRK